LYGSKLGSFFFRGSLEETLSFLGLYKLGMGFKEICIDSEVMEELSQLVVLIPNLIGRKKN